jgi:hypothetical protein
MALVRERTIPIERPPLVGEVSANLHIIDHNVLVLYIRISDTERGSKII